MVIELNVRAADQDDQEYIQSTLKKNNLPTADVSEKLEFMYVCERDGTQIGVGGLEKYGEVALLRSVAIKDTVRRQGYGSVLCKELLETAWEEAITEVYLLTTTAEEFFDERGFVEIDRDSIPTPVQNSEAFKNLCPESVVCMKRDLRDSSPAEKGGV